MKQVRQTLKRLTPIHTVEKVFFLLFLVTIALSIILYVKSALAVTTSADNQLKITPDVAATQSTASNESKTDDTSKVSETPDKKESTASTNGDTYTTQGVTPAYAHIASASPRGLSMYVAPTLSQLGRPYAISSQPIATWLGEWNSDIRQTAAQLSSIASSKGTMAVFVAYNIPGRDCGSYSAGGLSSATAYKTWVRQLAAGIGNNRAIVILEPDALAQIDCLSSANQSMRYELIADAVNVLATQTKAFVYIDAGHSSWVSAGTMAGRLAKANIAQARGFALNVSNFIATSANTSYGNKISASTGKSFVIDTSRNGNGANGEWCNPRGRALGASPTTNVGANIDAYIWAKVPGESDGACNGGPGAGGWWEEYAQELISNRR